ncbi:hypothetical protein NIES208_11890 [[Limnothrix rosea] IAM M-220]|nr:hypothetical protein NIES208_11890 [[Limnothrix rosea] IAM M-220]
MGINKFFGMGWRSATDKGRMNRDVPTGWMNRDVPAGWMSRDVPAGRMNRDVPAGWMSRDVPPERLYISRESVINGDDPMKMIRHHHPFIWYYIWSNLWGFDPFLSNNFTDRR